ncbi:MAG: DNA-binding protein [Bacteroidetes bacterium]|nr:MAG: DNA-binding protein [Bacteroidota bacterium]
MKNLNNNQVLTLDNYCSRGFFPYSKIGGKVFVCASDVEDYLTTNIIRKEVKS